MDNKKLLTNQNMQMRIPVKSTTARRRIALLVAGVLLAGTLTAQTVTLNVKATPIQKVCKAIEKQTGYYFVYPKDLQEKASLVTMEVKNAGIQETLEKVFRGMNVSWKIIDKVITINTVAPKMEGPAEAALHDTLEVNGIVMTAANEYLVNASVTSMATKKTIVTNERGAFKLQGLRNNEEIMISYTGYKPQKIQAVSRRIMYIKLEISDNELDKVMVQAYGTTSRRLTTSSISSLSAKDIEKQAVTNVLLAMQTRMPGVDITQVGGAVSGPVKVEIRGRNSINPNFPSDPLYIIDGVPLTTLDVSSPTTIATSSNYISRGNDQNAMSPAGGQSPLYNINPFDIESVEVLKDADATAIYGSRAANGVILITTKKGKPGKTKLTLNMQQGVRFITRYWDFLNTSDYLAMRREAFRNDNIIPTALNAPDLFLWDTTRYTNWQKYSFGHMAKWSDVQLGISGGTAQTTYRLNAGYNNAGDISKTGSDQKASLSFNVNSHSSDQKFSWDFGANYVFSHTDAVNSPNLTTLAPNAPAIFDSTGNIDWNTWKGITAAESFSPLFYNYTGKTKVLGSKLTLSYTVLKGLTIRTNVGYNNTVVDQTDFRPKRAKNPFHANPPTGSAIFANSNSANWIVEPQAQYRGLIGAGSIDVLVGGTVQASVTTTLKAEGSGITNDALLQNINYATKVTNTNRRANYKYAGAFFRIGYNWRNKYILNVSGRRDGSSRFGPGKQYGNFGAVGAAWLASEEDWLHDVLPASVSLVKLRGSYGIVGSAPPYDYAYLSQWGNATTVLAPYNGISVLAPQILDNDNFHWEVKRNLEYGFTLGFLQDNLTLDVTHYRNRCNNQLVPFPIPDYTGFKSVLANQPANVQNSGWEFSVSAKPVNRKNFSWMITYNLSFNRNVLLSYPDFEHSPFYNRYRIGESLDNIYLYNYTGLDPLTGVRTYEDRNHDGIVGTSENLTLPNSKESDKYIAASRTPEYYGSLNNSITYKTLQLSFSLGYKKQKDAVSLGGGSGMTNLSVWAFERRWKNIGDMNAQYPRITNSPTPMDRVFGSSTGGYIDASFIRLQNIALHYALPPRLAKKIGMSGTTVGINTQNLFTLTRYKGQDPDVNSTSIPNTRVITATIGCSF